MAVMVKQASTGTVKKAEDLTMEERKEFSRKIDRLVKSLYLDQLNKKLEAEGDDRYYKLDSVVEDDSVEGTKVIVHYI